VRHARRVAAAQIVAGVHARPPRRGALGIHCHNDSGWRSRTRIARIEAGAVQVQGTINGFGERCGNANLLRGDPDAPAQDGLPLCSDAQLERLGEVSRYCYEVANLEPDRHAPYVGRSAFAHKGGLHVSAIRRNRASYEHIDPSLVGNEQRVLVSDLSAAATSSTRRASWASTSKAGPTSWPSSSRR
jgi:2-isopropylmalate synthase